MTGRLRIAGRTPGQAVRLSRHAFAVAGSILLATACHGAGNSPQSFCEVLGPPDRVPRSTEQLHAGMSRAAVEGILGEPDYSPIEGQYYFVTGGACELEPGRTAPCGYVLTYGGDKSGSASGGEAILASCWWGAIGE